MSRGSVGSAQPKDVLPFEEVYVLYHDRVYRYCLRQLQGHAAAEDITGDVFTAALAAYDRVRPHRDGVFFWLLHIAKNHALSHLRRQQRFRRALGRLGPPPDTNLDVEGLVTLRDEVRRLASYLSGLDESDRSLIGLRVGLEMSYRQIADATGMTPEAAEWATQRAIRRARVACAAVAPGDEPHVNLRGIRQPGKASGKVRQRAGLRPPLELE